MFYPTINWQLVAQSLLDKGDQLGRAAGGQPDFHTSGTPGEDRAAHLVNPWHPFLHAGPSHRCLNVLSEVLSQFSTQKVRPSLQEWGSQMQNQLGRTEAKGKHFWSDSDRSSLTLPPWKPPSLVRIIKYRSNHSVSAKCPQDTQQYL